MHACTHTHKSKLHYWPQLFLLTHY